MGFPTIQFTTGMIVKSWDSSVYTGLCQFHEAKGFDPDSQELALHVGQPLYEMSSEMPFAHCEAEYLGSRILIDVGNY